MKADKKKIAVLCFLALWLQISVAPFFSIWNVAPDFIFLFFAFFVLLLDRNQAIWWAFGVGLIRDFLSNTFFGLETISLVSAVLILNQISKRFDSKNDWVQIWSTFFYALAGLLIFLLFFSLVQEHFLVGFIHFVKSILIAIYTTLAMFLFFPILKQCFGIKTLVRQYELF